MKKLQSNPKYSLTAPAKRSKAHRKPSLSKSVYKMAATPRSALHAKFSLSLGLPALFLTIVGLITVYSASLTIADASLPRQLLGVAFGLIAAGIMWRFDYRNLSDMTTALLIADLILFVLPLIPGLSYSAKGMAGWISIPLIGLRLQPSEVMKLVTIFYIAGLACKYNGNIRTLDAYVKLCIQLLIPVVLLMTQDLGTSLIVLVAGAAIIICAGSKKEWVIPTLVLLVVVVAVVVFCSVTPGLPHILHDYQIKRLLVFVDPSIDPSGDGYNLKQATIAVGSGGFLGKGLGQATQAGQGFLPEAHTDFAFALFAEQFGFLGSMFLLALYAWLMFSTIRLAFEIEDVFGKLVLVGIVGMWSFQILENIGMCMGIMPITGIPLPFISYGATSMVVQLFSVGVVESVYRHRKKAA